MHYTLNMSGYIALLALFKCLGLCVQVAIVIAVPKELYFKLTLPKRLKWTPNTTLEVASNICVTDLLVFNYLH